VNTHDMWHEIEDDANIIQSITPKQAENQTQGERIQLLSIN